MIPVCVLLSAIVVIIVAAITIFLHPTKLAKQVIVLATIIAFLFGVMSIIGWACCKSNQNGLVDNYNNLMLYYSTVNYSSNEFVRYDYYDKVQAYNKRYEEVIESSQSKWTTWFYDAEVLDLAKPIDFTLHGDDFYGEG